MSTHRALERLLVDGWLGVKAWQTNLEPESLHLEFKRHTNLQTGEFSSEDRCALAEAVSAFANVEGGLLVFGVHARGGNTREPDRVQSIPTIVSASKFHGAVEREIHAITDPPVAGVRVERVEQPGTGSGVVLVSVPASEGGPHRANVPPIHGRYYMRTATSTTLMPHSLLAALFHRSSPPKLRLRLYFYCTTYGATADARGLSMRMRIANIGRGAARMPALKIEEVDNEFAPSFWWRSCVGRSTSLRAPWTPSMLPRFEKKADVMLRSSGDTVIYPGDEMEIVTGEVAPQGPAPVAPSGRIMLRGTIFAVNARPVDFDTEFTISLRPDLELTVETPSDEKW